MVMAASVVTGGASGIGRAVVERLLSEGRTVISWDISPAAPESAVIAQQVDVTDRSAVEDAISGVCREHGGVELLVNCAGTTRRGPTETLPWSEWSAVIDLNLHGTFNCLQAAGRVMLETGQGVIVNVASIAAERGGVGRAAYCASKAGVVALTRVAGVEWAARGVRVNAVGPGWTRTPLTEPLLGDASSVLGLVPAGRLAGPEEIAGVIAFLASPDASFISGEVIYADGGYLASFQVGLD
jgi:3-oxoacyl-[acyl-carrier protein] reductase